MVTEGATTNVEVWNQMDVGLTPEEGGMTGSWVVGKVVAGGSVVVGAIATVVVGVLLSVMDGAAVVGAPDTVPDAPTVVLGAVTTVEGTSMEEGRPVMPGATLFRAEVLLGRPVDTADGDVGVTVG